MLKWIIWRLTKTLLVGFLLFVGLVYGLEALGLPLPETFPLFEKPFATLFSFFLLGAGALFFVPEE